jgi:hypothetical protein
MPIQWIDVNSAELPKYSDLRQTLYDALVFVLKPEITGVKIYKDWIYEVDPNTMLGKITAPMRATSGTFAQKVRCWTIGISQQTTVTGEGGVPPYAGVPTKWEDKLIIDMWGLFENEGIADSQKIAEDEAQLVSAFLWRNVGAIREASGGKYGQFTKLNYTNLQSSPFSDGKQVIVASGVMTVDVNSQLTQ